MSLERRALLGMCVLIAINQLGFGAIVPVMPLYAQSYGVTASAIGLAVAIYGLARFIVAMPAGQAAERLGRRPTLALGGLISALGNVWCALADTYPEFIVARFFAGAGAGLILTTGQVVLADITTPERRGRTMAIYQGTFIFAVGVGPYPGGLLATHWGLSAPFMAYAIAGVFAGAIAWFLVPETRELGRKGVLPGRLPPFSAQIRALTQQVGFMLVGLVAFTNAVARTGGLFSIVPILISTRLNLPVDQIGLGLALGSVAGLIATYPAGVLADKYGRKAIIVPATIVSGFSMLGFCFAPSLTWYLAACVVWGTATSVGGAAPAAYAADSAAAGMNAAAMSTYRMLGDLGYVIGPIALGLIVDWYGPQAALIIAAIALMGVGATFGWFAPESRRPKS
ncbi:MAG: DHA1 family multidrug resistance protein-like MFS transporter [Gammaproteobacteria bacterium]|jgi:DHA1 family multidrug resistance protein-like MFS transporter